MNMKALGKVKDCDIPRVRLCRKVFRWLIFLYVPGFYLPVLVSALGWFKDNAFLKTFLPGLVVTTCVALPLIALFFTVVLGRALSGSLKWLVLPLCWLVTIVPVIGMIGFVALYQVAGGRVGAPVGVPPQRQDIRRCTCGEAMLLTRIRRWLRGVFAIGFEGFYKCQKCGHVAVIPSTSWQIQQVLGCVGCTLIVVAGIFIFLKGGMENPFSALIAGAAGCGGIYEGWKFVRGIRDRRRFPVMKILSRQTGRHDLK